MQILQFTTTQLFLLYHLQMVNIKEVEVKCQTIINRPVIINNREKIMVQDLIIMDTMNKT
jgi:hypothetical protein